MKQKRGIFTISLDFELYWGMRDVISKEDYWENLEGTPQAVEALLDLFKSYGIHVTWATVGFLFFKDKEDLLAHLPDRKPRYTNRAFDLYDYLYQSDVLEEKYHFALSLLQKIAQTPHQEIATHTFSHYYTLEEGQGVGDFEADLRQSVVTMQERFSLAPVSLVFPRNQYDRAYLSILHKFGIRAFRGNEWHWVYRSANWEGRMLFRRLLKLIDTYVNITGYHTYDLHALERVEGVVDIPSSRFLRPFSSRLRLLERLKAKRIKDAMHYAAKEGEIFHLWWHPHNFGKETSENITFLKEILEYYQTLQKEYGMRSLSMMEISKEAI